MPTIIYIEHNGTEHKVEAKVGVSLMVNAVKAMVPGILADCGGHCSCGTCHGYIDAKWVDRIAPPTDEERDMLMGVLDPLDNSRLTCQIQVTNNLDGMVVHLPVSQT